MSKILVIEDDQLLQKVYRTILVKEGYDVDVASDGQQGLDKANANEPDLILLDMLMPHMNGVEFLRAYDILGKHPRVKVIGFSNTELSQWVTQAMELGATRYMTKHNFTPRAMVGLIRETLAATKAP